MGRTQLSEREPFPAQRGRMPPRNRPHEAGPPAYRGHQGEPGGRPAMSREEALERLRRQYNLGGPARPGGPPAGFGPGAGAGPGPGQGAGFGPGAPGGFGPTNPIGAGQASPFGPPPQFPPEQAPGRGT
jgi:hypothetical protein